MPRYYRSQRDDNLSQKYRSRSQKRYNSVSSLVPDLKKMVDDSVFGTVICIRSGRSWNDQEGAYDYYLTLSKQT